MTDEERQTEINLLNAKLDASRGQPGYGDRVKAIEARLAELGADSPDAP